MFLSEILVFGAAAFVLLIGVRTWRHSSCSAFDSVGEEGARRGPASSAAFAALAAVFFLIGVGTWRHSDCSTGEHGPCAAGCCRGWDATPSSDWRAETDAPEERGHDSLASPSAQRSSPQGPSAACPCASADSRRSASIRLAFSSSTWARNLIISARNLHSRRGVRPDHS